MYRTAAVDQAGDRIEAAMPRPPRLAWFEAEHVAEDDIDYYRMRAEQERERAELAGHPKACAVHLALAAAYRHRAAFLHSSLEAFAEPPPQAMKSVTAA